MEAGPCVNVTTLVIRSNKFSGWCLGSAWPFTLEGWIRESTRDKHRLDGFDWTTIFFFKLNLLEWHWLITFYEFQVYNSITHCVLTTQCLSSLLPSLYIWPLYLLYTPPNPFPSGNHNTIVYEFVCFAYSFVAFCFMSHRSEIIWRLSFLYDLFHLAWYSQDPSTLLQIALFYPF